MCLEIFTAPSAAEAADGTRRVYQRSAGSDAMLNALKGREIAPSAIAAASGCSDAHRKIRFAKIDRLVGTVYRIWEPTFGGARALKARLRIRIDFQEGTIAARATRGGAVGVAFRRALIVTETGESSAGRSRLTKLAKAVVERYYAAERVSADAADRALNALISLTPEKGG